MLLTGDNWPQTSALPPNLTWNTVWQTQNIGVQVQMERFEASKYAKMLNSGRGSVPDPAGSSQRSPDFIVFYKRDTPTHSLPHLVLVAVWVYPKIWGGSSISSLKSPIFFFRPFPSPVGLRGSAVERQSLVSVLLPSCARHVANGWPLMWVNRPL